MNAFITKYKTIFIVVVIILLLVIMTWGVMKFTGIGSKIDQAIAERKLADTLDAEINAGNVSLTQASAETLCQKLYSAMKGIGTDEDAIYEVFASLTSRSDIYFLIRTFGCKNGKTLIEWITSELNSSERTHLNEILAANNVNYQF